MDLREELGTGTGTEWVFTLTIRLHCFPGSEQWRPTAHRALLAYMSPSVTSLNCGRLCPRSSPSGCLLLGPGRGRKTPACTLPGATAPALLTEQALPPATLQAPWVSLSSLQVLLTRELRSNFCKKRYSEGKQSGKGSLETTKQSANTGISPSALMGWRTEHLFEVPTNFYASAGWKLPIAQSAFLSWWFAANRGKQNI